MPDILLIQPPIRDFYLTRKRTIPYGLACIAAVLEAEGFSVEILDALATRRSKIIEAPEEMAHLNEFYGRPDRSPFALFHGFKHFGWSFEHIGHLARQSKAPLVGVSSLFTPYMDTAVETARIVKALHPDCKLVMGGHHPTALPESVMAHDAVDFVLRGEGEASMPLLARAVLEDGDIGSVPGVVHRDRTGQVRISAPAVMPDLTACPIPAMHLLNHRYYRRGKSGGAVVTASRGCPMRCTYCCMGASSPIPYRRRPAASVIREIEHAVERWSAGFIDFEDENLSLDRPWFMDLLKEMERRFARGGLEPRAMNGLYPPSLDEEMIRAMKRAGFSALNLSLGATRSAQLKGLGRDDIRDAFDRALRHAETHDLEAVGYVIAGGPRQRADDSIADLLWFAERRVLLGVSIFYPAPGSVDYRHCRDQGLLPETFSLMRSSALPLNAPTSRKEAATILRLGRILNFMKHLLDSGDRIPRPSQPGPRILDHASDRIVIGKTLLQWFLHDGGIRGVGPDGEVFEHVVSRRLTEMFITGLKTIRLRGCSTGAGRVPSG
ncbi:MAG: B12-binding domain-containing radical SAM protein [Desulfobacterales bacterium]|nr:B12-binding domain-containing radical SAM protein [Desulfobacterales bacterium]